MRKMAIYGLKTRYVRLSSIAKVVGIWYLFFVTFCHREHIGHRDAFFVLTTPRSVAVV